MTIEAMKMKWQEWWIRNEWQFIRVHKKETKRSGEGVVYNELSQPMKNLVNFLMKQLRHKYWDVRAASALALGKSASTRTRSA
jgi:hypothetical protein